MNTRASGTRVTGTCTVPPSKAARPICTFAEGLAVMDLIDASERALQSRMWVSA